MDIRFPERVSEIIAKKLVAWREVFQQQRIAAIVEKLAEEASITGVSIAESF